MKDQNGEKQIQSIYQLCIKRLGENRYNLVFIYQMTDGSLSYQEHELNLEQTRAYFKKKGWPEAIPQKENQAIEVVHCGEVVIGLARKFNPEGDK